MINRRQFVKAMGAGVAGMCVDGSHRVSAPGWPGTAGEMTQAQTLQHDDMTKVNNQIRREKFDTVLPEVMKRNDVDMWIHVMRETIPDPFGAEDLGSTSGMFVFTNRGGDRIERAILGRRWGASFAPLTWPVTWNTRLVETCGAYDIIDEAVTVKQLPGSPITEYDCRFAGLREFVEARHPTRIAVNYKIALGPYPTTTNSLTAFDGLSHTDYLLLSRELGPKYADRLISSEFVSMDYIIRTVPTEVTLLKTLREEEDEGVRKAFAAIVPGVTKNRDVGVTIFRREAPGISQRGRTPGYENLVIQGGDIVAAPSQGTYAYVLRKGETEPPAEIKQMWSQYQQVDKILTGTIKVGLTAREIKEQYKPKFESAGFHVRDEQLQLFTPPEDFPAYVKGLDPTKSQLCIDCHGMAKGAQNKKYENYLGPRIGSNGPEWTWDIPLPPNHRCVMEYFIYMPWASREYKDQYLFWWDHEQVIVTPEQGIQHFSPLQAELYLIK